MKICMYSIDCVFNNGTGGVRRFQELMNYLKDYGYDVYLFSADATEDIHQHGFKGRSINKESSFNNRSMVGLKFAIGNTDLFREIRNAGFDRVVVFDVRAAFSLVINRVHNIILFIRQDMYEYKKIQLEDNNVSTFYKRVFLKLVCLSEYICLKAARKIVVQCKFDLDGLINRHKRIEGLIKNKAIIQINNINPSWVSNSVESINDNKQYDIVFVGNFKDSRKGHWLLLKTVARLLDEGETIKIAIIGDGKQLDECKRQYQGYENIIFLGRLKDPTDVMRVSRLMVVPSYVDSCPNTVMEALFNHVPVIGANKSGIPEILNNSEWLFDMDENSLAETIRNALNKDMNRQIISEQMTRAEELTFDWGRKMAHIVES